LQLGSCSSGEDAIVVVIDGALLINMLLG
jgi:hypothetical protein